MAISTALNRVLIGSPRNATSGHTVDPSSATDVLDGTAFTPTAGRLLICIAAGSVTSGSNTAVPNTAAPTGWTAPTNNQAVNNTGLYVWYKTAAGGDTLTVVHNAANYPVGFEFIEFTAGSTIVKAAASTNQAYSSSSPSLTGLTGTNTLMAVLCSGLSTSGMTTAWTSPTIEDCDVAVLRASSTDGYTYSLGYLAASTLTSWAPASVSTGLGTNLERVTFAVNVSAGGGTDITLTGAVADLAIAAPNGTLSTSSATDVTLAGAVGAMALAAPNGTVSAASTVTNISLTGAVATFSTAALLGSATLATNIDDDGTPAGFTLAAPVGTVTTSSTSSVALTGAVGTVALAAPNGTVTAASTSDDVALTGEVCTIALAAPAGTVVTSSIIDVALNGAVAEVAVAALDGTLTISSVGDVSLVGEPAALALTAPAGSITTSSSSDVDVTGEPATMTLVAPAGSVTLGADVTIVGEVATFDLAALAGSVALTSLVDLIGQRASLSLAAPAGTFYTGEHPARNVGVLSITDQSRVVTIRDLSRTLTTVTDRS